MSVDQAPAALKVAVEQMGGQSATARLLKVSQAAVWKWLDEEKMLPAEHVLTLEAATQVSRHDLRPDIYPREGSSLEAEAQR